MLNWNSFSSILESSAAGTWKRLYQGTLTFSIMSFSDFSEMFVSDIASYAIRRSNVVFQSKVRQSPSEIIKQSDVSICDGDASRTSFPNPHHPNTVEAILS